MPFKHLTIVGLALLATACTSLASDRTGANRRPDPRTTERYQTIAAKLPGYIEDNQLGAISVTYIEDGETAWTQIVGEQADGIPATEKTLFGVASLTKPVTAELVMRLASQGKLDLDEPIHKKFTDQNVRFDERHKTLTPRILLQHEGGFLNWRHMTDGVLRFEFDPGTDVQYAGEGYDYLVRFLEEKFKKRFEVLVQEEVFDPIGMKDTAIVYQPYFEERRADRRKDDGEWFGSWTPVRPSGANNLATTTEDYARFVVAVMNNEGLTKEAAQERLTITRDLTSRYCGDGDKQRDPNLCPDKMGFGISWYLYEWDDHTLVTHDGSNWGEKSIAIFSPELRSGVVAVTNGQNGRPITYEIAKDLYSNPKFFEGEGF